MCVYIECQALDFDREWLGLLSTKNPMHNIANHYSELYPPPPSRPLKGRKSINRT